MSRWSRPAARLRLARMALDAEFERGGGCRRLIKTSRRATRTTCRTSALTWSRATRPSKTALRLPSEPLARSTIDQQGKIKAGADGINAKSSADAEAKVEQEASQENLINGVDNPIGYNDAYQSAAAAAIAVADEVNIATNGSVKAGDDGVVGISVADADAEISQTLVKLRPVLTSGRQSGRGRPGSAEPSVWDWPWRVVWIRS